MNCRRTEPVLVRNPKSNYPVSLQITISANVSKQQANEVQSKSDFHSQMLANTRVMRIILRNIAEESGFIVEEKLQPLLAPYMQEQRTIIEIDNIFNVRYLYVS